MFDLFETYLKASSLFSINEIALVRSLAISKNLKKKQYLLRADEACRFHTFVCSGCLRSYRIDSDGGEHIMGFSPAGHWISGEIGIVDTPPSGDYIDALEDSDVIQLSVENFNNLVRDVPSFGALHARIIAIDTIRSRDRIYQMISQQAEERYLHFLHHFPQLCHRVPLFMIASYLGVARETLTRIRGNVLDRG